MRRHLSHLIIVLALAACASDPAPQPAPQEIVMTGEITRADHQTYREIPFTVPPGTKSITIDFAYAGKENRTVIDIGVRDPEGQRGWSGGNKSHLEIGAQNATPSYRPGPIQPGEWKLVLGIPNIRHGQTASYTATVSFDTKLNALARGVSAIQEDLAKPRSFIAGRRLRGDFHTHTGHSDGSCEVGGQRQPCPTIETATAARHAGLDFVVVTDHNTITQLADIKVLQGGAAQPLLISGTEITTFNGHANVIGNSDFLDFQLGSPRLPTLAKLFDQVDAANAFISINHPSLPSGEACMGCGWTVKDTDWSRVTAIEVINGASMRNSGPEGAFNGIAFWEKLLREGHRITAIAGSDNHDATDTAGARQSPVGTPTTIVHAMELSAQGVIAGVKSGRVFIDAAGLPEAWIEMGGYAPDQRAARMGGEVVLGPDEGANIIISRYAAPAGARIVIVTHNLDASLLISPGPSQLERVETSQTNVKLAPGASHGYIRPELRAADGKLLLLGNPIYVRRAG